MSATKFIGSASVAAPRDDLVADCRGENAGREKLGAGAMHPGKERLSRRIDEANIHEFDPYRLVSARLARALPAVAQLVYPGALKLALDSEHYRGAFVQRRDAEHACLHRKARADRSGSETELKQV
ncbi:MAG TPA: hypothetical protein VMI75_19290 [Polyangiaceae bacterium]|nr:hypothetical protein [Polyangiaceae bacterium]